MRASEQLSAEHRQFLETRYFPSLDGLRGLAVVAVIWHHAAGSVPGWFGRGFLSIDLFFTLSGFLITTLLLRERDRDGTISLRNFYLRRALRIFPLYYAVLGLYVVVVLAARPTGAADQQAREAFFANVPAYATYTSNWFVDFHGGTRVIFGFAWSLATEEQFYLLWPLVVCLGRTWRLPVSVALALAGLGILVGGLAAGGTYPGDGPLALRITSSIPPPICFGCVLAYCLHSRKGFAVAYRVLGASWSAPAALATVLVTVLVPSVPRLAVCVAVAALVGACCIRPRHALSPALANRVVMGVGTISYGMYLLHMLVLNAARRLVPQDGSPAWVFLLTLAVTALAAAAVYRWYERPLLRLKHRLSETAGARRAPRRVDRGPWVAPGGPLAVLGTVPGPARV